MDEEIAHVAQGLSDDIDNMVMETFEHFGQENFSIHSLGFGDVIPPVNQERDLPSNITQGSMCYVHDEDVTYVYTGERWVPCMVERDARERVTRVTIRDGQIRTDRLLRRNESG